MLKKIEETVSFRNYLNISYDPILLDMSGILTEHDTCKPNIEWGIYIQIWYSNILVIF